MTIYQKERIINLSLILFFAYLIIFGAIHQVRVAKEETKVYKRKLIESNKIKNKDLLYLNSIFRSNKPIYRIYENGWCLSYEPCGYKKSKNK